MCGMTCFVTSGQLICLIPQTRDSYYVTQFGANFCVICKSRQTPINNSRWILSLSLSLLRLCIPNKDYSFCMDIHSLFIRHKQLCSRLQRYKKYEDYLMRVLDDIPESKSQFKLSIFRSLFLFYNISVEPEQTMFIEKGMRQLYW